MMLVAEPNFHEAPRITSHCEMIVHRRMAAAGAACELAEQELVRNACFG